MSASPLSQEVFDFLTDLTANNEREWFSTHKDRYLKNHAILIDFAEKLLTEMGKHDHIETPGGKKSLYRIYRDTRFSKDKTPYKNHWSGGFRRATAQLRGGYYFHLQPGGKSHAAGGFWAPNKDDLFRIRQEIATDAQEMRDIIAEPHFVATFGELQGSQLKTAPKGFDREHPAIDLLRYKQYVIVRNFSDAEVLSEGFVNQVDSTFQAMRPFFDYMSEILTTDANGVSLV
ncbi:MAG TPA: DUF2461 domain-containing protein [Bacteroidetes bacterium]|nr:DUF2461 domain-containing protein [Bacteroidota bacterium]